MKNTIIGVGGAGLVALAVSLGAGHITKHPAAPVAPVAVGHGICENGKLASKVTVNGNAYKLGAPCVAVVPPAPVKKRKH